jgi:sRNA-binding carbon storage regulator CsrA
MALVITRHEQESFTVDGPARITIEHVRGRRAVVSIEAPGSTKILRSELKQGEHENGSHQPE